MVTSRRLLLSLNLPSERHLSHDRNNIYIYLHTFARHFLIICVPYLYSLHCILIYIYMCVCSYPSKFEIDSPDDPPTDEKPTKHRDSEQRGLNPHFWFSLHPPSMAKSR